MVSLLNKVLACWLLAASLCFAQHIQDNQIVPSYSGVGACAASNWVHSISRNAAPACTQPGFADILGTISLGQLPAIPAGNLPADIVYNDQTNTGTTSMTLDLSGASPQAGLRIPVAAGAAPTQSGQIAYDSRANQYVAGVNGVTAALATAQPPLPTLSTAQQANPLLFRDGMKYYCYQNLKGCTYKTLGR